MISVLIWLTGFCAYVAFKYDDNTVSDTVFFWNAILWPWSLYLHIKK